MKTWQKIAATILVVLVVGVLVTIFTSPDTLKTIIDNIVIWVQKIVTGNDPNFKGDYFTFFGTSNG